MPGARAVGGDATPSGRAAAAPPPETRCAAEPVAERTAVSWAEPQPVDRRGIDSALIAGLYRRTWPLIVANFGALALLTLALWARRIPSG